MNTASKRSSAINVGSPWRSRLPFPDGSVDQPDRQAVPFMYAGIAADGGAPPAAEVSEWIIRARRRGRR